MLVGGPHTPRLAQEADVDHIAIDLDGRPESRGRPRRAGERTDVGLAPVLPVGRDGERRDIGWEGAEARGCRAEPRMA